MREYEREHSERGEYAAAGDDPGSPWRRRGSGARRV